MTFDLSGYSISGPDLFGGKNLKAKSHFATLFGVGCFLERQIHCKIATLWGEPNAHHGSVEAPNLGKPVVDRSGFANL